MDRDLFGDFFAYPLRASFHSAIFVIFVDLGNHLWRLWGSISALWASFLEVSFLDPQKTSWRTSKTSWRTSRRNEWGRRGVGVGVLKSQNPDNNPELGFEDLQFEDGALKIEILLVSALSISHALPPAGAGGVNRSAHAAGLGCFCR